MVKVKSSKQPASMNISKDLSKKKGVSKSPKVSVSKSPKIPEMKGLPPTPKIVTASAKKHKKEKTSKKNKVTPKKTEDATESTDEEVAPVKQSPHKVQHKKEPEDEDKSDADEMEEKENAPASTPKKQKKPRVSVPNSGKENTVFVRNLFFRTDFKSLKSHFKQFGEVLSIFMSRHKIRKECNLGFAFVTYSTKEEMNVALQASHTLDGRDLAVLVSERREKDSNKRKREAGDDEAGPAQKKTSYEHQIFVRGLDLSSSSDTLQKHFSQFGSVVNVSIPLKSDSSINKGYAFVSFTDAAGAQAAIAEKNHMIDSKAPTVSLNMINSRDNKIVSENEIFITRINKMTEKHTLEKHFSAYGKITRVTLPWDRFTNRCKGFGFVAFETSASMHAALAVDHEIDGTDLVVRMSRNVGEKSNAGDTKKAATAPVNTQSKAQEDDDEESDDEEKEKSDEEKEKSDEEESDDEEEESDDDDDEESDEE